MKPRPETTWLSLSPISSTFGWWFLDSEFFFGNTEQQQQGSNSTKLMNKNKQQIQKTKNEFVWPMFADIDF